MFKPGSVAKALNAVSRAGPVLRIGTGTSRPRTPARPRVGYLANSAQHQPAPQVPGPSASVISPFAGDYSSRQYSPGLWGMPRSISDEHIKIQWPPRPMAKPRASAVRSVALHPAVKLEEPREAFAQGPPGVRAPMSPLLAQVKREPVDAPCVPAPRIQWPPEDKPGSKRGRGEQREHDFTVEGFLTAKRLLAPYKRIRHQEPTESPNNPAWMVYIEVPTPCSTASPRSLDNVWAPAPKKRPAGLPTPFKITTFAISGCFEDEVDEFEPRRGLLQFPALEQLLGDDMGQGAQSSSPAPPVAIEVSGDVPNRRRSLRKAKKPAKLGSAAFFHPYQH
ncbi:hypothetical protein HDU96_009183 [Phlyctochytrium bullatum]|nr:hypothetical protein HDU96_009183 [Phlyctochytrium bullatum]